MTLQKIAEFDSDGRALRNIRANGSAKDVAMAVSSMRNKRLDFAKDSTKCSDQLYYLVTRVNGSMLVFEHPMDYIDVDKIEIVVEKDNSIRFHDTHKAK